MIEWYRFAELLARYSKTESVVPDDILFGAGLNLSSIHFVEFIMELEEEFGLDIDVDDLDASIKTVGELYQRIRQQA